MVEGVGLQVESVVEVVPCGVVVGLVVDNYNLRLIDYLLTRGNVHGAVDNLAEHVEPDTLEVGKGSPVATGVALDGRVVQVLEVLRPDELRSIPNGATVDTCLFHDGSDTGTTRILLAMLVAQQLVQRVVPAAVVIAHAVVLGQTRHERAPADALVIVEAAGVGVFVEKQDGLGVFPTGSQEILVTLQFGNRVSVHVIGTATPANGEEATVVVRHLDELGKQGPAVHFGRRTFVACHIETPELLGKVPAEEVRISFKEVFESLQVVVLNVGVATRCGLAREPEPVGLTNRSPRLVGAYGIARHAIHFRLFVELARQRQVHTDVGFDVVGNEVDDFLRVGRVPHINMNEPQWMLIVNRSALLGHDGL